jgi:hypothetical protein
MRRDAANAGRTGSPLFSLAMKRSWAGEVAGSFWVEGRRLLALKKKRPARAAFLRGLKCEPVYLWFSARTLLRKAACLLAAACIFLRMDPERWISWAKLRRKTLLQEAMSPEEP